MEPSAKTLKFSTFRTGWFLLFIMWGNCSVLGTTTTNGGNMGAKSNILFILTDDQDVMLTGHETQPNIMSLIAQKGVTFTNMFVTTPVCCPSRSSILTGRYITNIAVHNNSVQGNCAGKHFAEVSEHQTYAAYLKQYTNYTTFYAGKYLNQYGVKANPYMPVSHVPPGWDSWIGLVGNSVYYNYSLSVNGSRAKHGDNYTTDYLTDLIANYSIDYLRNRTEFGISDPFLMVVSTPAIHSPFDYAPQYSDYFRDVESPRLPSFNVHGDNKHWLVGNFTKVPFSEQYINLTDVYYRNRLRALMSVDDMVRRLIEQLETSGEINNTFVIFASDNGFHLGEFGMVFDKRLPYEFDVRVPMYLRGPRIPVNQTIEKPVLSIDIMPTILAMTNTTIPLENDIDGHNILALFEWEKNETSSWRTVFCTEYFGEHDNASTTVNVANTVSNPYIDGVTCPAGLYGCYSFNTSQAIYSQDADNNTYTCIRLLSSQDDENIKLCSFKDDLNFVEIYDLKRDPNEFDNLAVTNLHVAQKLVEKVKHHLGRESELNGNKDSCPCCNLTNIELFINK